MIIKHKQKNHSSGNNLVTPMEVKKDCERIWNVKCTIDAASTRRSRRCDRYVSKKRNFFKFKFNRTDILWLNPPHKFTGDFVKHARHLNKTVGCGILMLIPVNTMGNPYFKKHAMPYIRLIKKMFLYRIKFLNPRTMKPSKETSVNAYVTIYFRKK